MSQDNLTINLVNPSIKNTKKGLVNVVGVYRFINAKHRELSCGVSAIQIHNNTQNFNVIATCRGFLPSNPSEAIPSITNKSMKFLKLENMVGHAVKLYSQHMRQTSMLVILL